MRRDTHILTLPLFWDQSQPGNVGLCPLTGNEVSEVGCFWLYCARTQAPVAIETLKVLFPENDWSPPSLSRNHTWRVPYIFHVRLDVVNGASLAVRYFRAAVGDSRHFFTNAERSQLAIQVLDHAALSAYTAGFSWSKIQRDLSAWMQNDALLPALRYLRKKEALVVNALGPHSLSPSACIAKLSAIEHNADLPTPNLPRIQRRL